MVIFQSQLDESHLVIYQKINEKYNQIKFTKLKTDTEFDVLLLGSSRELIKM